MSETLYLGVAVFVFVMMMIGLVLTVIEFRFGQPRREHEEARGSTDPRSVHETRVPTWAQSRS